VLLFEFLNRISFFSILSWSFFFIAAVGAILLTSLRSPLLRRYRGALIAVSTSSMILGVAIWSIPFFLSRLNPDQSRLTPIDQLVTTEWIEPLSNPQVEVATDQASQEAITKDEVGWATSLGYQFKYKLRLGYELKQALVADSESLVLLDQAGNLHGFRAYTGLNHWQIRLRLNQLLDQVQDSRKLYLLERTSLDSIRISCLDFTNPALLWQRTIPRSKEGSIALDPETQTLYVSSGESGVWALKSKTGEVLWKRPEVFSKVRILTTPRHILAFEPRVATREGHWFLLDPANGKTLQKTPHDFNDMLRFTPSLDAGQSGLALAQVDAGTLFLLDARDLSQRWRFHSDSPVLGFELLPGDRVLQWMKAQEVKPQGVGPQRLELRSLLTHEVKWQRETAPSSLRWIKFTPDLERIMVPSELEGESRSISFYAMSTGVLLGSAHTSEPLIDLYALGDWVYFMSENHIWAVRRDKSGVLNGNNS